MTKAELRKIYKQKRLDLSEKERVRLDDLLLINFQHVDVANRNTLLSYWPLQDRHEVNTHLMTDFLAFQNPGLQIAFPIADFSQNNMRAELVDDNTEFALNEYGIAEPVNGVPMEPSEIDIVFVPMLACSTNGYRVGYGKGFYDRFLALCREDVLKIGFSYFEPVEHISDINEFDVSLNICITPKMIYEF